MSHTHARRHRALVVALAAIAAACTGGGHSMSHRSAGGTVVAGVTFVRAPASLIARCRATAMVLGYPVPCPTRVPAGLRGWPRGQSVIGPSTRAQERAIVDQPDCPACAGARGWAFGSSVSPHLVIAAAPYVLADVHHAVDGPGFDRHTIVGRRGCFPRGGVCHPLLVRLGRVSAHGWRISMIEATRWDESGFTGHLVMVWTVAGHTYAAGFHEEQGRAAARRWDTELLRGLRLVSPT
jgi:hypothetical protein